ncbi:hypothetical protein, partial [Burkholderia cenocepacia]|uniref:hypothetical protein n=1 Tax=Burkholderia cenocepacia TaxID=95486 RepID=UPI002230BB5B
VGRGVRRGGRWGRSCDVVGESIPATGRAGAMPDPVSRPFDRHLPMHGVRIHLRLPTTPRDIRRDAAGFMNKLNREDYKNAEENYFKNRNGFILFSTVQTRILRWQRSLIRLRHSMSSCRPWRMDHGRASHDEEFRPFIRHPKIHRKGKALQYKIVIQVCRLRSTILFGRIFIGMPDFKTTKRSTIQFAEITRDAWATLAGS